MGGCVSPGEVPLKTGIFRRRKNAKTATAASLLLLQNYRKKISHLLIQVTL